MTKFGILSTDVDLIEELRRIEELDVKNIVDESILLDTTHELDVILISDKVVPLEQISVNAKKYNANRIFYMVSSENFIGLNIGILKKLDIIIIPPKKTIPQIVSEVKSVLFGSLKGHQNVFVFYGADSKVGTTNVAQSVAEKLAENANVDILYMSLSGVPGVEYFDSSFPMGLDDLKAKIASKVLTQHELKESCTRVAPNLAVLKGAISIPLRRHYLVEHIARLIDIAAKAFDVIVIDAGSGVDYGLIIGALNSTQNRFLVVTQQAATLKAYDAMNEQVLSKLLIGNWSCIVNKYVVDASLLLPEQVAQTYKAPLVATLPFSDFGWQAEKESKCLLHYDSQGYVSAIEAIASLIFGNIGIEFHFGPTKKGFRLWGGKRKSGRG